MKGHVKIRGNFHHVLVVLPAAIIMLFVAAIMLPAVSESTHAEGDEPEEGISIVASSDISVNLLSKDEGYYKIFKDSIKVSTGSENGYTLSIATDSADHQTLYLNGDTTSESKIDGATGTYEEPKALGDYEWGFAVPGISHFDDTYSATDPSEDSKFAILPLENKIIRDYTEAATDHITDIYYGFKLSGTLEPGEYETSIIYTAVPADQPLVARAILGQNKNLNFVYDRKTYTVGETYTDNLEETEIVEVYDVPMDAYMDTSEFNIDYCPAWVELDTIYYVNFDNSFYGFKPTSTSCWFYELRNLTTVTNANNLNTSNVTNMAEMFGGAGIEATTLSLDFSGWNTSKVTDMEGVFESTGKNAASFTLDLNGWDVSNVTNMKFMFANTGQFTTTWSISGLNGWDTGNVTNMFCMFEVAGNQASVFSLDLSGWDVSNVENMSSMFSGAGYNAITWGIGDLSGWDTGNVTNMSSMFQYAGAHANAWDVGNLNYVDEEHKGWDVSSVTDHSDFVDWSQPNINTSRLPWQSNY
ncbi:MAG: BspA family leucine-rich repeat surface protein [Candidatus Saccharibacteria bacterium]|nr:BspA family leucine-rich repeat surface protein [Candidatus Saccharibacteria bacterium]